MSKAKDFCEISKNFDVITLNDYNYITHDCLLAAERGNSNRQTWILPNYNTMAPYLMLKKALTGTGSPAENFLLNKLTNEGFKVELIIETETIPERIETKYKSAPFLWIFTKRVPYEHIYPENVQTTKSIKISWCCNEDI